MTAQDSDFKRQNYIRSEIKFTFKLPFLNVVYNDYKQLLTLEQILKLEQKKSMDIDSFDESKCQC